jgi:hypothetical protein
MPKLEFTIRIKDKLTHQFSLFGFQPDKIRMDKDEKSKLAQLLHVGKAHFIAGNHSESIIKLREFREGLEDFERRLSNQKKPKP